MSYDVIGLLENEINVLQWFKKRTIDGSQSRNAEFDIKLFNIYL